MDSGNFITGNFVNGDGVPLGLGMALAQNNKAMAIFSGLNEVERQNIIDQTHQINSKEQMREFVDNLV